MIDGKMRSSADAPEPATQKNDLESKVKIRFHDCDPLGHLNNARYLDYFLSEREEQLLHHYDLNIREIARNGKAWVVNHSSLSYLKPALYGETVLIRTRVVGYSKTTIQVEGLMLDEEGKRVYAAAWFEFAYVDLNRNRLARHEEQYMDLFSRISMESQLSFESNRARLKNIMQEISNDGASLNRSL